ncbi:MAG: 50S ribosomal protein L25/general stress protein Ctc [Gammaproteobacteria bacterium]|nr:50S ribosomal protein L25/general stress protein Ctc [Gammaproteobacteria bacterium]
MSDNIQLNAEPRADSGKGASRRLRRMDKVPAIVYGGDNDPVSVSLGHNEFAHELENEAIYTQIIDLHVGSVSEEVILRDLQRHPYKKRIMHADFFRIDKKKPIHVVVPIHVLNTEDCVGVKMDGGMMTQLVTEIEVVCLPKYLPEYLEIDAIEIHLGDIVHLSDIKMPEGVEIVALTHGEDHDTGILSVVKTRAIEEISDEAPEAPEIEDDGAAPEDEASED